MGQKTHAPKGSIKTKIFARHDIFVELKSNPLRSFNPAQIIKEEEEDTLVEDIH